MSTLPPIKEEKRKKKRRVRIKEKEIEEEKEPEIIEFQDSSPKENNNPLSSTSSTDQNQNTIENSNETKRKIELTVETTNLTKTNENTQDSSENPKNMGNLSEIRKNNAQSQADLTNLKLKRANETSEMTRYNSTDRYMTNSNVNSPDFQNRSTFHRRSNNAKHHSMIPQAPQNSSYLLSSFGQPYTQPFFQGSPLSFNYQHQMPYYGSPSPMYYPQSPFFNQAINSKNDEHDKKLLDLIERQTEVIGHLNTKILNQEYQKLLKGRKELNSRLRQLELANALKQKELDARIHNNLISPSMRIRGPEARIQEDNEKKQNKNSRVLQLLSKFVIANEMSNTERKVYNKPRPHGSLLKHAIDELTANAREETNLFPYLSRRAHTENDQLYNSRYSHHRNTNDNTFIDN